MKKTVLIRCFSVMCVLSLLTGTLSGCKKNAETDSVDNHEKENTEKEVSFTEYDLAPIAYENTALSLSTGSGVGLVVPEAVQTGEKITAELQMKVSTEDAVYYIIDWGDGTWSYNGPFMSNWPNSPLLVTGEVYHTYLTPGAYTVKASAFHLKDGKQYGWTRGKEIQVEGEAEQKTNLITMLKPIASSEYDSSFSAVNIADNDNKTTWKSKASDIEETQWVGYLFDDYYKLDSIEIKTSMDATVWPSNIAIEYTEDGGENWFILPKYYYIYPSEVGKYSILMNFPNPSGATLDLPLDTIVANGIRISSKVFPIDIIDERTLSVSEMRVFGSKDTLFYTSRGGVFDASINNMYTIYGSALTEPRMYNSLKGGAPNVLPFKSGMSLLESTEWLAWDGIKHNWYQFEEAKTIIHNTLVETRYGGDGFYYDSASGKYVVDETDYNTATEDGFIWGSPDLPKHLWFGNHYTNNSIFIIAARNYLLYGNDTEGFMESRNVQGQDMYTKLEKAITYMLKTHKGETGVLTIVDPRNDATPGAVASNYWDTWQACGYQSSYENSFFYESLLAMRDIEIYLGHQDKAQTYQNYADKVKVEFNKLFWDTEKKRYITSVDPNGKRIDFGFVPANVMAVAAGLADDTQAKDIYDWLDGERIIETDTSKGGDIYRFIVSPRTNTLDIAATGAPFYWYDHNGVLSVEEGRWGAYGNTMQNGGSIFYVSYYDIMGRFQLSNDEAYKRFDTIVTEFGKDQLRRNPYTTFGDYQLSILGEFPESGLVPTTYVVGFMGLSVVPEGLSIQPKLPSDLTFAGVREYCFNNTIYEIEVSKDAKENSIVEADGKIKVTVKDGCNVVVTRDNKIIEK